MMKHKSLLIIFSMFAAILLQGCMTSSWVTTPAFSEEGNASLMSDAEKILPMKAIVIFPVQIDSSEAGRSLQKVIHSELAKRFRSVPDLSMRVLSFAKEVELAKIEDPFFWIDQARQHQSDGILFVINQHYFRPSAGDKVVEALILTGSGNPQTSWRVLLFDGKSGKPVWDRVFLAGVSSLSTIGIIAASPEDTLAPLARDIAKNWPVEPDEWALGHKIRVGSLLDQAHYLGGGIEFAGVGDSKVTTNPSKYFKSRFPLEVKTIQYTIKVSRSTHKRFKLEWFLPNDSKVREKELNVSGWNMDIDMDIFHLDEISLKEKEGIWTVKVWADGKLIDHRKFLIGAPENVSLSSTPMTASSPPPTDSIVTAKERSLQFRDSAMEQAVASVSNSNHVRVQQAQQDYERSKELARKSHVQS